MIEARRKERRRFPITERIAWTFFSCLLYLFNLTTHKSLKFSCSYSHIFFFQRFQAYQKPSKAHFGFQSNNLAFHLNVLEKNNLHFIYFVDFGRGFGYQSRVNWPRPQGMLSKLCNAASDIYPCTNASRDNNFINFLEISLQITVKTLNWLAYDFRCQIRKNKITID